MVKRARFELTNNEKIEFNYSSIEEYVNSKFEPYFGQQQIEIYESVYKKTPHKIPKNINKLISDKILGKDEELQEIFPKTKFIIKNIPLTEKGYPRERMAFNRLKISDFDGEWEDSYWKKYYEETTFIMICYAEKNKSRNGYRILKKIKTIKFNQEELLSFKKTYNQLKIAIKFEDPSLLPIPNSFEGQLLELAPKGQKGDDAYNNFFKENSTKTCFMLNKRFINKKLNE